MPASDKDRAEAVDYLLEALDDYADVKARIGEGYWFGQNEVQKLRLDDPKRRVRIALEAFIDGPPSGPKEENDDMPEEGTLGAMPFEQLKDGAQAWINNKGQGGGIHPMNVINVLGEKLAEAERARDAHWQALKHERKNRGGNHAAD